MAAIAPPPASARPETTHLTDPASREWTRLLAWAVGVVAAVDVVFIALVGEIIPPLAISAVLSVIGLVLVRRFRRAGAVVLGLVCLLMLVGGAAFALPHLAHPSSGIDFFHAVVGIFGRLVGVGAAVMAVRRSARDGARRVGAVSMVLLAASLLVAGVATAAATGEEAEQGDVATPITHDFEERIEVTSGDTLFIDNQKAFRHTFTVEGTSLDVEVPASQGVRVPVDLAPGTYEVICNVPGHEYMRATLEVR